jgi:hypothetical protein
MPSRVGSALDHLAAAIVALAVFALPISFMALTTGHHDPWFLIGFALACLLAGAAVLHIVAGPGWPSMLAAIIGMGAVTWLGGVIAAMFGYGIEIDHGLCGHAPATSVAFAGAVVVYAVVAGWSLAGSGGPRFFLGPSAGAALAIAWALASLAVIPGGHGYCET